ISRSRAACTRSCSIGSTWSGSRARGARTPSPRSAASSAACSIARRSPRRSARTSDNLITDVLNELFGLGPLEALLSDPTVSDILVNRADQIYIERNGRLELTDTVFRDNRHVLQIIERIVSSVGRRIDESSPMVDARLQDGSRVNAIIAPLAL